MENQKIEENTLLQTCDLSVGYDQKVIVEQICFSLQKGEIISMIGPNGAGKSTILKTIVGELKKICGVMYLQGNDTTSLSEKELAKTLSIVFTNRIRTEYATVKDVVAMGRYPYTGRLGILSEEDWKIVSECMEWVHVTYLKDRDFMTLSDGQKQRVMLAKALCQEPDVLILDEPTSFLDVKYKLEFMQLLQEMTAKRKLGVLMSLHELDLAQRISEKMICVSTKNSAVFLPTQQVFTREYLPDLYGFPPEAFDEKTASVELKKPLGEAEVFVIAGNGMGIHQFRLLQRQQIPFSVGILAENDMDYPVAKALASKVITGKAFEVFGEKEFASAKEEMLKCKKVLVCLKEYGTQNALNEELIKTAQKEGLPVQYI